MMSLPLCRASSKMSIMPSGATQRSDTKVLLSLKRNTPGRSPFERRHVCPSQRVHSKQRHNRDTRSPEHKARLEALGFDWDPYNTDWEKGFEHLQAYLREHKDCRVPPHHKTPDGY